MPNFPSNMFFKYDWNEHVQHSFSAYLAQLLIAWRDVTKDHVCIVTTFVTRLDAIKVEACGTVRAQMVYLPLPQLASASRKSYGEAYANILTAHRRSPLTSASSVIMLVAPDVDALCAARMLADLFKQDDVMHRVVPVSGIAELERMRDELMSYSEVSVLLCLF